MEMMQVEVRAEHRWLEQMVGEWTYEVEAPPKPGADSMRDTGRECVRSLGDVWVVAEGRSGGGDDSHLTIRWASIP